MKTRTLYDVLQVTPKAAPPILRAAHEHLSAHHEQAGDPAARRLVDDAYATLTDPVARAAYDRKLAELAEQDAPPSPAAPRTRPRQPAWVVALALLVAVGVGYGAATMWHQRELTRMVLEHEAQLIERQAQIHQLRQERIDARADQRAEEYAARRAEASREAEERRREREIAATRNRLDNLAARESLERQREAAAQEREAQMRLEQARRERAAADARNAALAQERLAQDKQTLEELYRDNYPRYR
jgi:hypothetical protein